MTEARNMESSLQAHGSDFYGFNVKPEDLPKGFENMPMSMVDGIIYLNSIDTADMKRQFELMRNLNVRDGDVMLVGYPRSGNHWTFEVAKMVLREKAEYLNEHFMAFTLDWQGEKVQSNVDSWDAPRILSTHCRIDRIPKQMIDKKCKIIQIIRNPKDVLSSIYTFAASLKAKELKYTASWDEFFDQYMEGKTFWGCYLDHILAAEKFMKENPDVPVFIRSFERAKIDLVGETKKLAKFLGKSEDTAAAIASLTEFSAMKKGTEKKMDEADKDFFASAGGLLRTGQFGSWKKRFTVAQSEAFDKYFEEKMRGSKLAEYVREYL